MLHKYLAALLLSIAALSAYALPPGVAKQDFCFAVANNVMSGFEAKGQFPPETLEYLIDKYKTALNSEGFSPGEVEQLIKGVETGYFGSRNPNLMAEDLFKRCIAQKDA